MFVAYDLSLGISSAGSVGFAFAFAILLVLVLVLAFVLALISFVVMLAVRKENGALFLTIALAGCEDRRKYGILLVVVLVVVVVVVIGCGCMKACIDCRGMAACRRRRIATMLIFLLIFLLIFMVPTCDRDDFFQHVGPRRFFGSLLLLLLAVVVLLSILTAASHSSYSFDSDSQLRLM